MNAELQHRTVIRSGTQTLEIAATADGVRSGLARIVGLLHDAAVRPDVLTAVELAMAEVLNNIVEHAYADLPGGTIHVVLDTDPAELQITVIDDGREMPTGRLPPGNPADPERPASEQAEGGYGMFMIRQLARKLRYRRLGSQNQISFRVSLDRPLRLE